MQSRVEPVPLGGSPRPVAASERAVRATRIPCLVRYADGSEVLHGTGEAQFVLTLPSPPAFDQLMRRSACAAGLSFMRGEFDVNGDLVAAIRFWEQHWEPHWFAPLARFAGRVLSKRPQSWLQTRARARRNILFHYDRSNEFYRLFLDERMVYSCAYYQQPDASLEDAQLAKLDHICRKLDVQPGTRFLDIGSGWGALVLRAAEAHGADATGCTLSNRQFEESMRRRGASAASSRIRFLNRDYRELNGEFEAISSVGMFEHVGRRRLRGYFDKVASLLAEGGRFLNHGIARAKGIADDPSTRFIQERVFPGGELTTLDHVIATGGRAGLEAIDVENLRSHYALTCREWVRRLEAQRDACVREVGEQTWRAWRLYLAGSARNFEAGDLAVYQVLFAKRGTARQQLTRKYMYV